MLELSRDQFDRIKTVVETWNFEKVHNRSFNQMDMRRFCEIQNDRTRALLRAAEIWTYEPYQRLAAICADASDVTKPGANLRQLGLLAPPMLRLNDARNLVARFGVNEPDFYTGLAELCINAQTLLTPRARLIADGVDRTNV